MVDWPFIVYVTGALLTIYALNRDRHATPELFWTCVALWPLLWFLQLIYTLAVGTRKIVSWVGRMMG